MRKVGFLVTFTFAFSVISAQPDTEEKRATQITGSDFYWVLDYSEDGLLSGVYDGNDENRQILWNYDYHALIDDLPFVIQYGYYRPSYHIYLPEGRPTFIRQSKLNSDGLISLDQNYNAFEYSKGDDFEYEYSDGRMVKMTGKYNGTVVEFSWTEGNLSQIEFWEKNEKTGTISCSYTTLPAKGVCRAFNSPLMLLMDYYQIQSLGPLTHGYYGSLNQNLLAEMTISFTEKFVEEHSFYYPASEYYYPITKKASRKYGYTTDSDGNIISITISEESNENVYSLEYGNSTSDIRPASFTTDNQNYYYNLQGRRLTAAPQKGIYIQNGKKKLVK